MLVDIWVDFNDIEEGSRTCTLLKFADRASEVHMGATVRAIDDDGNTCLATVTNVDGASVELALDMSSFRSASKLGLATAV